MRKIDKKGKACKFLLVGIEILLALLLVLGITSILVSVIYFITEHFNIQFGLAIFNILTETCMLIAVLASSLAFLWFWDKQPFSDLGLSVKGRFKDMGMGAVVALLIYLIGFGVLYGLDEIEILSVQWNGKHLLLSWIFMVLVAFTEEILLRGFVLGRLLNAGMNRMVALWLSSALFSLMHIFNPDFSLLPFINIMLAGVLLGTTYVYTRNLWFPISLHLFWNWIQGPILGFEVSGQSLEFSAITQLVAKENIINGGHFGFEGSIICTALMIIFTIILKKVASTQFVCDPCLHSIHAPEPVDE